MDQTADHSESSDLKLLSLKNRCPPFKIFTENDPPKLEDFAPAFRGKLRTQEDRITELRVLLHRNDEKMMRQRTNILAVILLYETEKIGFSNPKTIYLQNGEIFEPPPTRDILESPVWVEVWILYNIASLFYTN
jgi:hypothetical protein